MLVRNLASFVNENSASFSGSISQKFGKFFEWSWEISHKVGQCFRRILSRPQGCLLMRFSKSGLIKKRIWACGSLSFGMSAVHFGWDRCGLISKNNYWRVVNVLVPDEETQKVTSKIRQILNPEGHKPDDFSIFTKHMFIYQWEIAKNICMELVALSNSFNCRSKWFPSPHKPHTRFL